MFEYEIADITADQLVSFAKSRGWVQVPATRENIILIESPDKERLILCEPGVFSDERAVMRRAIEYLSARLLRQEMAGEQEFRGAVRSLLAYTYFAAYHRGHDDTVESRYTDVLQADQFIYWLEEVDEILEDSSTVELAERAATS